MDKTAQVSYDAQLMYIATPYNSDFVEELKVNTKSRRWNPEKKVWTVALKERDMALQIIRRHFPIIEDDLNIETPESVQEHKTVTPITVPLKIDSGDRVDIWTDGACFINPGSGGYAAIISNKGQKSEMVGGFNKTTNNRMEIMGAIVTLESLGVSCKVKIFSDSQYLVNSMSKGWAKSWKAKGWMKKGKKIPNWDLWDKLITVCSKHDVKFIWVKGHNSQQENERCNYLAEYQARLSNLPPDNGYLS